MKSILIFLFGLSAINAQAESLTCTLQSGDNKSHITTDFASLEDEYFWGETESPLYDLSFTVEGKCNESECQSFVTISSVTAEEEIAQLKFNIVRQQKANVRVLNDSTRNTYDGKTYLIYCDYQSGH